MDAMSLKDIWLVAIPEISFSIIFGLLLINRKVFKNRSLVGVIKFIVSVIIVLVINYYSRIIFNHIILVSYCTVFAYALTFKIIWHNNIRQSMLVGLLIAYLIIGTEIITMPISSILLEKFKVLSVFSLRFALSIPSRIIDIIIILATIIFSITIETKLINRKWALLDIKQKTTSIFILLLFTAVIMFATNNIEIFVKLNQNGVDTEFINMNLQFSFYGIVFFMLISVFLLYALARYFKYKEIALKTPEQLLNDISQISPSNKINDYVNILQSHLLVKEVNKNEKDNNGISC